MAVLVENLMDSLVSSVGSCDEIVVISGYSSPDVIDAIAKLGKTTTFYYGMYGAEGITERQLTSFRSLQEKFSNLKIQLVYKHRVHTKCYLLLQRGRVVHALVGSANFSINGLLGVKNSEMLVELNETELSVGSNYLTQLKVYWGEIAKISISCNSPRVITKQKPKIKPTMFNFAGQEVFPLTGNSNVAIMPLYSIENGKKVINEKSGINWGLQKGHTKKTSKFKEAYIPVSAVLIDNYPLLFPPFPEIRNTTNGKCSRRSDSVTVLWDDGRVMKMVFSGSGVQRPTEGKRNPDAPYWEYPKQFTSDDGGGAILGEYLRTRLGVQPKALITLADFEKYGRDYVVLTYIAPGYYEADFSKGK